MKICVLGLDGAAPEIVLGDERLVNLRRLMDYGFYGHLHCVIPVTAVPAWMCMATSQDPGSLGVYGLRDRVDHSYDKHRIVSSASFTAPAIWDQLTDVKKKSIIIGLPPNDPPRQIDGISIGSFLAPGLVPDDFTFPPELKARIAELTGKSPRQDHGNEEIFRQSEKQWQVVRWLLGEREWDYIQVVDTGLNRVRPSLLPEYYLWLDEQIGSVLELVDDETMVLAVSPHGPEPPNRERSINEWLVREGLLVLNDAVSSSEELNINWSKTKAWSEDGQVFFNMQGREPQGVVPAPDYESFRDEIKSRLEASKDEKGQPLNPLVFKPKEIYRNVRNLAPDLIVQFDPTSNGIFILTAPNCPLTGEYEGAHLLDIAPTLLDLAGYEIPETLQGRSLVAGLEKKTPTGGSSEDDKQILHDRLAGLGYI